MAHLRSLPFQAPARIRWMSWIQKAWFLTALLCGLWLAQTRTAAAPAIEPLRFTAQESPNGVEIRYLSGTEPLTQSDANAPAGVALRLPDNELNPVRFAARVRGESSPEWEASPVPGLILRLRLRSVTPYLIERTVEATASQPQRFALQFPLQLASDATFSTFSGTHSEAKQFDTVRGSPHLETFPVAMARTADRVFGLATDSPGLWENRCQVRVDPSAHRMAALTGDGRAPYPLVIKPPEDARDTYQYTMDGWQTLSAGETRRYTTWVFLSPARTHYDAQLAAHVAVANAKGWNSSLVEAILRNTSLYLLRRNLALDADGKPRDGQFIFISGPGYGWKQWVSDGFYTALGLDDPEKTIEANRAVFWNRMDYEDNAHYYLIWAVLMKRAGGTVNTALVQRAYQFIRQHETAGLFIPPSLPGAPNPKGWKTYHDVLLYDEDDSPTSTQGFHCGALIAAKELGLGTTEQEIEVATAAYRGLYNAALGFMPTSRKQNTTLGQDTLYGATLTYAVFGRKLLTDDIVLTHVKTSERVRSPYGLRVISTADGSLMPGHSGVYCYGGSWFLNDAANYLLAEVHGMPHATVESLLTERIAREIAFTPAFNESISTVDGRPHGHVLYSWNSGYTWLRKQVRERLNLRGPDPIDASIDARFGISRTHGYLALQPGTEVQPAAVPLIGFTQLRTDLEGGRHANVRTFRAHWIRADGSSQRTVGESLANETNAWTQFAGWSRDGRHAVILRGWQDPQNAQWEEEHKTFRMEPGRWLVDSCLVDLQGGGIRNLTSSNRVSHYNSGLFFLPDGKSLGFTALIDGKSRPYQMDLDGGNKRDVSGNGAGFAYGYSASPDGKSISYHEDYQIYIANVDGSNRRRIETGNPFNFGPQWSPDGQWLLFVSGERGRSNPYVVHRDGSGLRRVADLNGYQGWILFLDVPDFHEGSSDVPVWAADSQSVFYTAKTGDTVELFQAGLDGKVRQWTHTAKGTLHYHPQPSPDGRWLSFGSKRDGVRQLFVLDLNTGLERQLTRLAPGSAAMWAQWQPQPKE